MEWVNSKGSNNQAPPVSGNISNTYIAVGNQTSADTFADADQFIRTRNTSSRVENAVIPANHRWQLALNAGAYNDATENRDRSYITLNEWKDISIIITPNNGSPWANSVSYYMDGYHVGTWAGTLSAPRESNTVINRFRYYVGTADTKSSCITDVRVYSGAMIPRPRDIVPITRVEVIEAPAAVSVGDAVQLMSQVLPENAIQNVDFRIMSGTAAAVSRSGFLIARSTGRVTVEAASRIDP